MRSNPTLRLWPMIHTGTVKWACLKKLVQSRLKPVHALVVETWTVLIRIVVYRSYGRGTP
jgi:hypothetical protein